MSKICYVFGHKERDEDNQCKRCKNWIPSDSKWEDTYWDTDDWGFGRVFVAITLGCFLFFVLLFGLIEIPSIIAGKFACNAYAKQGIEVVWNFFTGCMAHSEKFGWLPILQYFNSLNVNIP